VNEQFTATLRKGQDAGDTVTVRLEERLTA
jgi:hypothetical protein